MKNKITFFLLGIAIGALGLSAAMGIGLALYKNKGQIKNLIRSHSLSFHNKRKQAVVEVPRERNENKNEIIKITIDPLNEIHRISPLIYGSNLLPQSETEPDIVKFSKIIGITCFRFPGGEAPGFHWKDGSFDYNARVANAPLRNINYLMQFCKMTNTKLIIQVNVESGTAQEAAAWVEYMNNKSGFRVEYWELGNEVYGDWDKGFMSADNYAKLIKEYSVEMKKIDPGIKIGANWAPPVQENFNIEVMKKAGEFIDFASYHWYPNHTTPKLKYEGRIHPTPQEVMANYLQIPIFVKRIREAAKKYAPGRKKDIEIALLEWDGAWDAPNSDSAPYSQGIMQWSLANAIFHADCLGELAKNNVGVAAQYHFQDINFGLIRGWDREAGWGGQRWDGESIRPKAFAVKLFSQHFGDILVESTVENSPMYYKKSDWWPDSYSGDVPYISCYASKFSDKNTLTLILINKHEENNYKVNLIIKSIKPQKEARLYILSGPELVAENEGGAGKVGIGELQVQNVTNDLNYIVPAHSVNVLEIDFENP